jgi:SAM-dependent methyltransferase
MCTSAAQSADSKGYSGGMGKGAALRWVENKMLARHLRGRGVEIGALWRKFPVSTRTRVWYVDRVNPSGLQHEYPEIGEQLIPPDIVGDAGQLPFQDGSLNFIIASHVLEHMPLPLATLRNWYRTLAPRGVLLLKIPDKRYTFDRRRQRTPLQHLLAEDHAPAAFDKRAHFQDWIANVVGLAPGTEPFEHETNRLIHIDYSIHYHVWTDDDVRVLLDYTRVEMSLNWRPVLFLRAHFYRKECAVAMQRY